MLECFLTLTSHFNHCKLIQSFSVPGIFLNIPLQITQPILHFAAPGQGEAAFSSSHVIIGFQLEILVVRDRRVPVIAQLF